MHFCAGIILSKAEGYVLECKPESILDLVAKDLVGEIMTAHKDQAGWDWWRVGGRWDGLLTGNRQSSEKGFNFDKKHETIKNNMVKIVDLLMDLEKRDPLPFALATRDTWEEKGFDGDNDKWRAKAIKLLEANKDQMIVLVDYHS